MSGYIWPSLGQVHIFFSYIAISGQWHKGLIEAKLRIPSQNKTARVWREETHTQTTYVWPHIRLKANAWVCVCVCVSHYTVSQCCNVKVNDLSFKARKCKTFQLQYMYCCVCLLASYIDTHRHTQTHTDTQIQNPTHLTQTHKNVTPCFTRFLRPKLVSGLS